MVQAEGAVCSRGVGGGAGRPFGILNWVPWALPLPFLPGCPLNSIKGNIDFCGTRGYRSQCCLVQPSWEWAEWGVPLLQAGEDGPGDAELAPKKNCISERARRTPGPLWGFYPVTQRGGTWGEPCGVPGCFDRHRETLFYQSRDFIMKIAGVACF